MSLPLLETVFVKVEAVMPVKQEYTEEEDPLGIEGNLQYSYH